MAEFFGGDKVAGTSQADLILAGGGTNSIAAGGGNDAVFTGSDNDTVNGGTGEDLVYGGAGNDVLSGGADNDIILGGAGDDIIAGDAGDDILSGGSGADVFQYKAGFGNDIITDFVVGEDRLNFYAGAFGNTKNISISDFSTANLAANGITATDIGHGALKLTFGVSGLSITLLNLGSSPANPNVAGTSGNDTIFSGSTGGHLVGGNGSDTVLAGSGGSNLEGNASSDTLVGGAGSDTIGGQGGDDALFGNAGDDQLGGGLGNDTLGGGDGADIFKFAAGFGNDTIIDLNFDEGDKLSFVNAGAAGTTTITSKAQLVDLIHSTGASVDDGNDVTKIDFHDGNTIQLMGFQLEGL